MVNITLLLSRCWCQKSPGLEMQLVIVTSGPLRPPPQQCQTPRWDRLSACQLQGQGRLITWSDLFWWESLEDVSSLTCLWLFLFSCAAQFKLPTGAFWRNKVLLGKDEMRQWKRGTKNNSSWGPCCQIPGLAAVYMRFEYHWYLQWTVDTWVGGGTVNEPHHLVSFQLLTKVTTIIVLFTLLSLPSKYFACVHCH